jgi:hypothetical protein
MNKYDYERKALDLLDYKNTYERVQSDPTKRLQRKLTKILNDLRLNHVLTDDEYRRMKPGDSVLPLFYGQPKIHKPDIPLRPIIAFCGATTYNLAKELSKRLRPLTLKSNHMLKNSRDFIERIKDIKIDHDEVMVSFDVKSLFTCIPLDFARNCIIEFIENDIDFQLAEKWSKGDII